VHEETKGLLLLLLADLVVDLVSALDQTTTAMVAVVAAEWVVLEVSLHWTVGMGTW
jgi:hypothetical protein